MVPLGIWQVALAQWESAQPIQPADTPPEEIKKVFLERWCGLVVMASGCQWFDCQFNPYLRAL